MNFIFLIGCIENDSQNSNIEIEIEGENLILEYLDGPPLIINEIEIVVYFNQNFSDFGSPRFQNISNITFNYEKFYITNNDGNEYWNKTEFIIINNKNIDIDGIKNIKIYYKGSDEFITMSYKSS
jgi:hypothetical protein